MRSIWPEDPHRSRLYPHRGDLTRTNRHAARRRPSRLRRWSKAAVRALVWPFDRLTLALGRKVDSFFRLAADLDDDPLEFLGYEAAPFGKHPPVRVRRRAAIVRATPDGPVVTAVIVQTLDGQGRVRTETTHRVGKGARRERL